MLGNKAKPRRLNSKGNLSTYFRKLSLDTTFTKVGRALFNSIPVLSIFALVGILAFSVMLSSNYLTRLFGIDKLFGLDSLLEDGDKAYAATIPDGTPSASLTISGNGTTEQISAGRGSTAYRTHTVAIKAGDISDYSITISGPSNMTSPNGGSTIISTDGNKTGEGLAANTWGYAWGDGGSSNENMIYKALSTSGTNLTNNDKPTISNSAVEFSRKLVFAVKFDEDTVGGRYYANNVNLALTVSPKLIVVGVWTNPDSTTKDSGISTMQEMTSDICNDSSVKTGATMLLQDSRDENIYSIGKLADGKCWMRENLRLAGGTPMTSDNTDLNGVSSYALPASTTGGFDSTTTSTPSGNTYKNQQVRNSSDNDYGAYYSWCAATAGTCMTNSTTPVPDNTDASSSICPRGWKLPKGGSSGDFQALYNKYHSSWTTNNSKNGYWLGATNTAGGGAFFPAAGSVGTGDLAATGSNGYYWSRTASSITNAYYLSFYSSYVYPVDNYARYRGHSVRCVVEPQYTYTLEYNDTGRYISWGMAYLPAPQTITTSETSLQLEIAGSIYTKDTSVQQCGNASSYSDQYGNTYAPSSIITLTPDKPHIVLQISGTNGLRKCISA